MELHPEQIKLNIGAGFKNFDGWISVGLADHHEIKSDIRNLPLPDNYADEAMAIHVVEHINRWEVPDMLKDWRRVLKPGARLVIEQPELRKCCMAVLHGSDDRDGLWGLFGDPAERDELMMHRWCWTEKEMIAELKAAGFRKITSAHPVFHGKRKKRDMRLECVK
jgi:predicted SAM-dependent methyltransferase